MDDREPRNQDRDLFPDAKGELSDMLHGGLDHPSTKPVLKGAAVGAAAGLFVPVVGPLIGGLAGGGYALYKRIRD
ncbi:hypothetical protein [Qipengyuania mesophila]|uniref:Bacteriocin n=1 Tax=Qipengyuania mesophila TaxID=2867246 RepID=A0ABS7JYI6_9SPHN|nr:hypothetical protein [Qipengyuania mesophila]MBX7502633.1 hypothetical protein [Qipengyuania mesophila]